MNLTVLYRTPEELLDLMSLMPHPTFEGIRHPPLCSEHPYYSQPCPACKEPNNSRLLKPSDFWHKLGSGCVPMEPSLLKQGEALPFKPELEALDRK